MTTDAFIYLQFLRNELLPLPGVTEKMCFGTPAFYVNNKLFARIWEDGQTLVIRTMERDRWMAVNPEIYFITDHYLNYPSMLINMPAANPAEISALLLSAWQSRATKKLITAYEENQR